MATSESKKRYKREHRNLNKCLVADLCEEKGIEMAHINDYQIRLNRDIDVYPTSKKYFDIKNKKWGVWTSVDDLLNLIKQNG